MTTSFESPGVDYGHALAAVKEGHCVARAGWNGKKMFVFMRPGDAIYPEHFQNIKSLPQAVKDYYAAKGRGAAPIEFAPYLCLKSADDSIINGWVASQSDMLATDWEVVK